MLSNGITIRPIFNIGHTHAAEQVIRLTRARLTILCQQGFTPLPCNAVSTSSELHLSPEFDVTSPTPLVVFVNPKAVVVRESFDYPPTAPIPANLNGTTLSLAAYREKGCPGFIKPEVIVPRSARKEIFSLEHGSDLEWVLQLEPWEYTLQIAARQMMPCDVHSWEHTLRVVANAVRIAREICPQHIRLVKIAAYLHDVGRVNDTDEGVTHAIASKKLAIEYLNVFSSLTPAEKESILFAIVAHADGHNFGRLPVTSSYKEFSEGKLIEEISAALWDADRLDLARVRVVSHIFLSTNQARNMLKHFNRKWYPPTAKTSSNLCPLVEPGYSASKATATNPNFTALWKKLQALYARGRYLEFPLDHWEREAETYCRGEDELWSHEEDYDCYYFSGSASGSLIGLCAAQALVPTGQMLEMSKINPRIIPFSGELSYGISNQNGINKNNLSFTRQIQRAIEHYAYANFNIKGWNPGVGDNNRQRYAMELNKSSGDRNRDAFYDAILRPAIQIEEKRLRAWELLSPLEMAFVEYPFPVVFGVADTVPVRCEFKPVYAPGCQDEWNYEGHLSALNQRTNRLILYVPFEKMAIVSGYLRSKGIPSVVRSIEGLMAYEYYQRLGSFVRNAE
jgi:hypothetical protein